MDLSGFLKSLCSLESDDELIDYGRKYVLHGTPYIFLNREDEYYEFRKRIANKFNVAFNEVFITSSAKLGFSPFKEKEFDYDSDIDVAIVSNRLYFEFFQSISYDQSEVGDYKVSAGVFKGYFYLEEYTISGLRDLRNSLIIGEKNENAN